MTAMKLLNFSHFYELFLDFSNVSDRAVIESLL
jgi:hypothetical protein